MEIGPYTCNHSHFGTVGIGVLGKNPRYRFFPPEACQRQGFIVLVVFIAEACIDTVLSQSRVILVHKVGVISLLHSGVFPFPEPGILIMIAEVLDPSDAHRLIRVKHSSNFCKALQPSGVYAYPETVSPCVLVSFTKA